MENIRKNLFVIGIIIISLGVLIAGCGDNPSSKNQGQTSGSNAVDKQITESSTTEFPPANLDFIEDGETSLVANYYVIFDGSGSMREACAGVKKLSGAKKALVAFLDNVPEEANLGLFVFDGNGEQERVSLGPVNRSSFISAVEGIKAGGVTPLHDSIQFGADQLVNQRNRQLGYGDYRLIVVTDGDAKGIPEAVQYASKRGIPIYAIGLCVSSGHPLAKTAYDYRAADDMEALQEGLKEAVAESDEFDPDAWGLQ